MIQKENMITKYKCSYTSSYVYLDQYAYTYSSYE